MESFVFAFIVPVAAVILDSLFGDPKSVPHPVRFIGKGLELFEASARKVNLDLRVAGWLALVLFAAGAWSLSEFLMAIPYIGALIAIYLGFAGLALGCLVKDARHVSALLDTGDVPAAREALALMVSRDTSEMDANTIRQSLAETVSENLNDGFVAPAFYLAIFGPGGMWAYKVVSTMDSMWGYKTEEYKDLGYAAAVTDDWLAFIPARITAWMMIMVGKRDRLDYAAASANYKVDAVKMESPNAGWPMAAAAWLFGGQMGGSMTYFGETKEKPVMGPVGTMWSKEMVSGLINHCKVSGHMAAWGLIACLGWLQIIF